LLTYELFYSHRVECNDSRSSAYNKMLLMNIELIFLFLTKLI